MLPIDFLKNNPFQWAGVDAFRNLDVSISAINYLNWVTVKGF